MSLDIDALCAASLVRLKQSEDARIAPRLKQFAQDRVTAKRSLGQQARRLREALLNRRGQGD